MILITVKQKAQNKSSRFRLTGNQDIGLDCLEIDKNLSKSLSSDITTLKIPVIPVIFKRKKIQKAYPWSLSLICWTDLAVETLAQQNSTIKIPRAAVIMLLSLKFNLIHIFNPFFISKNITGKLRKCFLVAENVWKKAESSFSMRSLRATDEKFWCDQRELHPRISHGKPAQLLLGQYMKSSYPINAIVQLQCTFSVSEMG